VRRRQFTGLPSRVVRDEHETAEAEATMVAELHDALGRFPQTSISAR
jgi:hypothetical protein